MRKLEKEEILVDKFVTVPPSSFQKLLLFDLDETLIHCVEDIESTSPDVVLEILFPDSEEPVCAGINLRPYLMECLEQCAQYMHVGVFTASSKAYADAILDYLDPGSKFI
jgi:CTD small phosphatase-like protein 2